MEQGNYGNTHPTPLQKMSILYTRAMLYIETENKCKDDVIKVTTCNLAKSYGSVQPIKTCNDLPQMTL
jgi:hypothetical protein